MAAERSGHWVMLALSPALVLVNGLCKHLGRSKELHPLFQMFPSFGVPSCTPITGCPPSNLNDTPNDASWKIMWGPWGCSKWKWLRVVVWYQNTALLSIRCTSSFWRACMTLTAISWLRDALNWFQRHQALHDGDIHTSRGLPFRRQSYSLQRPIYVARSPWDKPNLRVLRPWRSPCLVIWLSEAQ